jgi:hypothetical protein
MERGWPAAGWLAPVVNETVEVRKMPSPGASVLLSEARTVAPASRSTR